MSDVFICNLLNSAAISAQVISDFFVGGFGGEIGSPMECIQCNAGIVELQWEEAIVRIPSIYDRDCYHGPFCVGCYTRINKSTLPACVCRALIDTWLNTEEKIAVRDRVVAAPITWNILQRQLGKPRVEAMTNREDSPTSPVLSPTQPVPSQPAPNGVIPTPSVQTPTLPIPSQPTHTPVGDPRDETPMLGSIDMEDTTYKPRPPSWGALEFMLDGIWPPTRSFNADFQRVIQTQIPANVYPRLHKDRPGFIPSFHIYSIDLFLRYHGNMSIFLKPCYEPQRPLNTTLHAEVLGFLVALETSWAVFRLLPQQVQWAAVPPPGKVHRILPADYVSWDTYFRRLKVPAYLILKGSTAYSEGALNPLVYDVTKRACTSPAPSHILTIFAGVVKVNRGMTLTPPPPPPTLRPMAGCQPLSQPKCPQPVPTPPNPHRPLPPPPPAPGKISLVRNMSHKVLNEEILRIMDLGPNFVFEQEKPPLRKAQVAVAENAKRCRNRMLVAEASNKEKLPPGCHMPPSSNTRASNNAALERYLSAFDGEVLSKLENEDT